MFGTDGRPLAFLTGLPFLLNQYPHTYANIAFHWVQGAVHVGLATFIGSMLGRYLPRPQAVLAVLPYLLWGFNGEVAMYSTGFLILLSSFFSLLGMHLITMGTEQASRRKCLFGALLILFSVLTYQSTTMLGVMVWVIILTLRMLESGQLKKANLMEGMWFLGGFIPGGLLTILIATFYASPRAKVPKLWDKIEYWVELNRLFFFWPKYYPVELYLFHGILLFLALVIPTFLLLKASKINVLLAILFLFGIGLILPYLANLIVAPCSFSFRIFYLAPLFLTLIISVLFGISRGSRLTRGIVAILVVGICCNYTVIAQNNARDYVRLYFGEVQVVRDLEKAASKNHYTLVAAIPDAAPCNPLSLHYEWADAHECDFKREYCVRQCIEILSPSLTVHQPTDASTALLREETRSLPSTPGIHIHPMPELHLLYLEIN